VVTSDMPCYPRTSPGTTVWVEPWARLRVLGGYDVQFGEDPGEGCVYLGANVSVPFCAEPCHSWSVDAFYRTYESQFDRLPDGKDGGRFHHVGLQVTYRHAFPGTRFFGWIGAGPEFFWTDEYLDDDSGFGAFGEVGVGYALSRHWHVFAGVNLHAFPTDVTREDPADDGDDRWLFVVAPMAGIEFEF
jgi:hypothetical protein